MSMVSTELDLVAVAPEDEAYFWSRTEKLGLDDCWAWRGTATPGGYGFFSRKRTTVYAHRLSYELHNGLRIPKGYYIMHTCDNRLCVNPNHLRLGSPRDNTRDAIDKGRDHSVTADTLPINENPRDCASLRADLVERLAAAALRIACLGELQGRYKVETTHPQSGQKVAYTFQIKGHVRR